MTSAPLVDASQMLSVPTHRITLAFPRAQEREFRQVHFRDSIPVVRAVLPVSAAFYAIFGLLDLVQAPGQLGALWLIRFGVFVPLAIGLLLFTYARSFERWMQASMLLMVVVGGLGIVAMIAIIPPEAGHSDYAGLILVLIIGYTYSRLLYVPASAGGWLIVVAYQVAAVAMDTPLKTLLANDFFFIGANLLGMLACRSVEQYARRNFLLVRMVRSEREQLDQINRALATANRELERLALVDGLTGIPNRRNLDQALGAEWARMRREGGPLTVVMCDIDRFKAYNDACGHLEGDDCLRKVARAVFDAARRPGDHAGRFGGEEFVVVLPGTDLEGGLAVGEALRKAVRDCAIPHPRAVADGIVTISIGVASAVPVPGMSPEAVVEAADRAMYVAKSEGRDRVRGAAMADLPGRSPTPSRFRGHGG